MNPDTMSTNSQAHTVIVLAASRLRPVRSSPPPVFVGGFSVLAGCTLARVMESASKSVYRRNAWGLRATCAGEYVVE